MAHYVEKDTIKIGMSLYGFNSPDQTITEFVEDTLPCADVVPRERFDRVMDNLKAVLEERNDDCPNCGADMRGGMSECCAKCKFLYPLKKFVNHDWEYSHVCLLFPFTEGKDDICHAMVIEHPEVQMCEMFYEVEE